MRTHYFAMVLAGLFAFSVVAQNTPTTAPTTQPVMDAKHVEKANVLIDKGVQFMVKSVGEDGGWSLDKGAFKPAVTALVLKALVQDSAYGPDNETVKKGYKLLLSYQQKDGGIYEPKEGVNNYETAVAVMALTAAGQPEYKDAIDKAVKYLKSLQVVPGMESPDGQKVTEDSPLVGAVNYGKPATGTKAMRPGDMSNMSFWMSAMHDAGVDPKDESIQRALKFINRAQNRSESNPETFAKEGSNDGGFVYSPVESKATAAGEKGLRSYGSMTYAGFKSMLYAGVGKDDPRVRAAYDWIRRYWTLDSNPNLPAKTNEQGLYYYYQTYAKALRAWGQPTVRDGEGKDHNWREELVDALAKRVKDDGQWANEKESRWNEGHPVLTTAYAVIALQEVTAK